MIFSEEKENVDKQEIKLPSLDDKDFRVVGLYGDIDEEKSEGVLFGLLALHETREKKILTEVEKEEVEDETEDSGQAEDEEQTLEMELNIISQPIDFVMCTGGGNAADMFAIYDVMRMVREDCDINTFGLGKVMSAGVLLLAAGTKGKRKIGRHCRVMIHSVQAGTVGSSHEVKNELREIGQTEEQYIKSLASETKMTEKMIRDFMDEKVNIYLSSEEAVEYGIADIIV